MCGLFFYVSGLSFMYMPPLLDSNHVAGVQKNNKKRHSICLSENLAQVGENLHQFFILETKLYTYHHQLLLVVGFSTFTPPLEEYLY